MKKTSKEKIIQSAILTLSKNPMASLDAIAEEAGLSRITVFRLFKNKKELIKELFIESYRQCNLAMEPIWNTDYTAKQRIEEAIKAIVPFGGEFNFLLYEPWRYDDIDLERLDKVYLEKWHTLVTAYKETGAMSPEVPTTWAANCLDTLIYTAWACVNSGDIAPNDAANLVTQQFFNGINKR